MEHPENSTASAKSLFLHSDVTEEPQPDHSSGDAYLYILIVMSFYGVFLCGIMLGYFRSKRRERRRTNVFTRLVHEEEQREWGALPKKHSLSLACPGSVPGLGALHVSLPFHSNHDGALSSPLGCVTCMEQSSVSSLCSSADTRLAIEEESDCGAVDVKRDDMKGGSEFSGEDSC